MSETSFYEEESSHDWEDLKQLLNVQSNKEIQMRETTIGLLARQFYLESNHKDIPIGMIIRRLSSCPIDYRGPGIYWILHDKFVRTGFDGMMLTSKPDNFLLAVREDIEAPSYIRNR